MHTLTQSLMQKMTKIPNINPPPTFKSGLIEDFPTKDAASPLLFPPIAMHPSNRKNKKQLSHTRGVSKR